MTSLVAWVGADQRGAASLNIATDSRISWGATSNWNHGRKAFASRTTADIFGYVGQVEFPLTVLGQVIAALEAGLIPGESAATKFAEVQRIAELAFRALPPKQQERDALLIHGSREGEYMGAEFRLWTLQLSAASQVATSIEIPKSSAVLLTEGSGTSELDKWHVRWERTVHSGTSRAIFSAFCDALSAGRDKRSGGAPQLVGLHRKGPGQTFGVIYRGASWYNGIEFGEMAIANSPDIRWRNTLFEVCDGSGARQANAQAHRVPKGLGNRERSGG